MRFTQMWFRNAMQSTFLWAGGPADASPQQLDMTGATLPRCPDLLPDLMGAPLRLQAVGDEAAAEERRQVFVCTTAKRRIHRGKTSAR